MDLSKVCSCLNNEAQIDGTINDTGQIDSALSMERQINSDFGDLRQVSVSYTGVDTDSIEITVDNTNKTISANIVQIQYTSKLNFPNVGSERVIYIDTTENATYRWDAENLSYVCVGRDYNEIEILSGGNA